MSVRRSVSIQLTILPLLATAAVASADSLTDAPPVEPTPAEPTVSPPGLTPPLTDGGELSPPDPSREFGPQDMRLQPPGMTPLVDDIDCDEVPYWEYRLECEDIAEPDDEGYVGDDGVVRGGFGGYFGSGGGS